LENKMQQIIFHRIKNTPSSLILRLIAGTVLFCSFISGIALYFFKTDLINFSSKIPLCLFHSITGMPCPFCGMTRAFLAIGQLKFIKAFYFHPLSIIILAIMIIYLCGKKIPLWLQHKAWAYLFLLATITAWGLSLINHKLI